MTPAKKEEKKAKTDMEVLKRLFQKPETVQVLKQLVEDVISL